MLNVRHPQALAPGQRRHRPDRRAGRPDLSLRVSGRRPADAEGRGRRQAQLRRHPARGQEPDGDRRRGGCGAARRRGRAGGSPPASRWPPARARTPAGTPSTCSHGAASRVAGLDLGFVPGEGGLDVAAMLAAAGAGQLDVVYLLGADEIDMAALGKAFVVYQGSHGDAGAQRADVILPGSAYTEKSCDLRQHRGPRADDEPRRLPAGRRQGGLGDRARAVRPGRPQAALRQPFRPARRHVQGGAGAGPPRRGRARRLGWGGGVGGARRGAGVRAVRGGLCATSISPIRSRAPRPSWPSSAR